MHHRRRAAAILREIIREIVTADVADAGVATMTGTLTTRYRRPTPLNTRLVCRGELERVEGRKVFCKATLESDEGVVAEAAGLYIRVDPGRYA